MAYFKENEQLLYLSEDHLEKQTIEDGINRKLTVVRSLKELVEGVEVSKNRQGTITIIVTANMMEVFKAALNNLVKAFPALGEDLQIVEIGIGEVFKGALTFVDVLSFVEFVRSERREEYINNLEEKGKEDESIHLRELLMEVSSSKERIEMYEEELEEKETQIEQLMSEHQLLKTKVSHVYTIQLKNYEVEVSKLRKELEDLKRLYTIEKEKSRDYEREFSVYRDENKGLELDRNSLTSLLEDRKIEIRGFKREIEKYKSSVGRLEKEKIELLETRVESEKHVILSMRLDEERNNIRELEKVIESVKIESRKKDFDIADLQEDINDLRKGEEDIRERGRTQILDHYNLKATNLFYFKIITDLPYLMSSLKEFTRILEVKGAGRLHVMILRNDEGLDSIYYEGIELYGQLSDVKESDKVFLLHPTRRMFTGIDKFDDSVDTLVVLDYIRSNKYYLSTDALGKYVTVVNESSMIRKLNLKGTPISLDTGSLLDITYDQRIDVASTQHVRDSLIKKKVETWMKKIDIL